MNKFLKINKLIKSGQLSGMLAQAQLLTRLDRQLKQLLEVPLRDHCQVLALRDRSLILAADAPVWAARLRFQGPKLARLFSRQLSVPISTIRVRVLPASGAARPAGRPTPVRRRSPAGKQALLQAARTVSDPKLKTALENLASHCTTCQDSGW